MRPPRRSRWFVAVAWVIGLLVVAYGLWAAYLAVFDGEGALPPRSRIPEVPAGARVVSDTKECASGGCWWELLVQPAPGQSPQDLAATMGVVGEVRKSWRVLDPHSVTVGSHLHADAVRIYVRY